MKNALLTGVVTLGTIAMTATSALAFNPEVKNALDNNDYASWVEAVGETAHGDEMLNLINESNFDQLVEAHNLRENGDMEGAHAIMEELGIEEIGPRGPRDQNGQNGQNQEQMQAVRDALDSGNYDAWVEAMGNGERSQRMLEIINESNFDRLIEIHNLRQQIQNISEELGLPGQGKFGPDRQGNGNNQMGEGLGQRQTNQTNSPLN